MADQNYVVQEEPCTPQTQTCVAPHRIRDAIPVKYRKTTSFLFLRPKLHNKALQCQRILMLQFPNNPLVSHIFFIISGQN